MSRVKCSTLTALCIALCVVLPMAFHMIPNAGSVYLPMHLPVLLCGLLCGGGFGLLCGIAGPLLSSLLTGIPPMAILPAMAVELAVYGLTTGILMGRVRTGKTVRDLYWSLVPALLLGRVLAGIVRALVLSAGAYTFQVWTTAYLVTNLPGTAIQLVLVPIMYFALDHARLIPVRYPAQSASRKDIA